jgi:ATP-dependent DNA ligase
MTEILPMLLSEVDDDSILDSNDKMFQLKMNGTRGIIHIKDYKIVGIRNRRNAPVLFQYKELKNHVVSIREGILDGEVVVLNKNGKSVYYSGIDQRRSDPTEKTITEYPVSIMVFDAITINGELLINKPYSYRYRKITDNLKETDKVKIITNYTNGRSLWKKVLEDNEEGIVIRSPSAAYELGERSKNGCLKLKNYKLATVQITGKEENSKGVKIFGKTTINGEEIIVECQLPGDDVNIGDTRQVKYLDIYNGRLIQPTRA